MEEEPISDSEYGRFAPDRKRRRYGSPLTNKNHADSSTVENFSRPRRPYRSDNYYYRQDEWRGRNANRYRSSRSPNLHRSQSALPSYRRAGAADPVNESITTTRAEGAHNATALKSDPKSFNASPAKVPIDARAASLVQQPFDGATQSELADLQLLELGDVKQLAPAKELEQIRDHYLGLRKEKKKVQKPSEKFRTVFNFEWSASEDTTREDENLLYRHRVEPQLLFGRGYRAGIDVREQRKHNSFYDRLIQRRVQQQADEAEGEEGSRYSLAALSNRANAGLGRDLDHNDPNSRHWSDKSREEMTERDWRIFREDFEIVLRGGRNVPPPMRSWEESSLAPELLKAIAACGYTKPTAIQMQAIPIAMKQLDLIGIAETGSGKTAAFVLPMIHYIMQLPKLTEETCQYGPYSLVLAPSRELALQIDEETRKFAAFCDVRAVAIVGGRNAEAQTRKRLFSYTTIKAKKCVHFTLPLQAFELRKGCEIIIGTPGRIRDCLERSYTVLNQCNYVILDEGDRMIDMGFEDVVNWILDQIPLSNMKSEDEDRAIEQVEEANGKMRKYRLTQMFSATITPAVERLAKKYLRAAAYISIGDPGAGKRAIEQRLEFISEGRKKARLEALLQTARPPIMVFVNQKKVVDVVVKQLLKAGFSAGGLHGGKVQDVREQSLADFKSGDLDILVATDVAGRGIDVEGVQLVVNYDMPKDITAYTHRIGRTGRAGLRGLAISFVTEADSGIFYDLKQLLQSTNNPVPSELAHHAAAKVPNARVRD